MNCSSGSGPLAGARPRALATPVALRSQAVWRVSEFKFSKEVDFLSNHNSGDLMGAGNLLSVLVPPVPPGNHTDACIDGIESLCPQPLAGQACVQCVQQHAPQLKYQHNCSIGVPAKQQQFQHDLRAGCHMPLPGPPLPGMIDVHASPLTGYCIDFLLPASDGGEDGSVSPFADYLSCNSCLEEHCLPGSPSPADGGAAPVA